MGRGKVELKRIENKISRQVSFSKRRTGLVKKAKEISVLCDAQVALLVFSPKGKLYQYSTNSNTDRILERYERHLDKNHTSVQDHSQHQENWVDEHPKLMAKIELLQKSIRHFMGEDLDPLSLKELQGIQHQLDKALKRLRSKKNKLILDSISQLQKQERSLQHQKRLLLKQLNEIEEHEMEEQAEKEYHDLAQSSLPMPLPLIVCGGSQSPTGIESGGDGAPAMDPRNHNILLHHLDGHSKAHSMD